ncbi:MAG: LysM peptidoglycan-binding domain-containing protein, partial [Thiobacillus sp.]|nr:LysM peptidoglycan-binding domain-containing protein [Thiobacillus sp.]
YTVAPGDTLFGIARRHGVGVADLLAANPALSAENLRPGQTLGLPAGAQAGRDPARVQPASLASRPAKSPRHYTVKRGDTLYAIARAFGIELADLKAENPGLRKSAAIHPGLRINLPAR